LQFFPAPSVIASAGEEYGVGRRFLFFVLSFLSSVRSIFWGRPGWRARGATTSRGDSGQEMESAYRRDLDRPRAINE
jgi:hypothetical protein